MVFVLVFPWPAAAEERGSTHSLDGAVQCALLNNLELRAARYAVEQAKGRQVQAGRWSNPEIAASGISDFAFGNQGEAAFSVGIYQMFPLTSRLALSRQIGHLDVERARREIRNQERLLVERVQIQYIQTLAARARAEKWRELELQAGELEELVRQRLAAGQGSPTELALVASQMVAAWHHQIEAEMAAGSHLLELKTLLGFPTEHPLQLTDSIPEILARLRTSTGDRPRVLHRPDADLLVLEADRADLEIRLARAEAWEGIRIGVEYVNEQGLDAPEGLGTDQFLGLNISVPWPLWNSNQGRVAENQALRDGVQARLDALRLELSNELAKALRRVDFLQRRVAEIDAKGIQVVRKAEKEMHEGFADGRVDLRDLLMVRLQLAEIEVAGESSRAELAEAYAKLAAVVGVPE